MRNKKNKKKWVVAATSLAAVALMAGTFAWFVSQDSAKNHFEGAAAGNDVEVVETFTPPKDWEPDQKVNKDVAILNSGEYDSLIRVSFSETIQKLVNAQGVSTTDKTVLEGKTKDQVYLAPLQDTAFKPEFTWTDSKVVPTTFTVDSGDYAGTYTLKAKERSELLANGSTEYHYVLYWDNGTEKYYAKGNRITRDASGLITPDIPAEFKYIDLAANSIDADWLNPAYNPTISIDASGSATIVSKSDANVNLQFVNLSATPTPGKWFYNSADGYFYYVGVVKSQEQTPKLLDSVTLASTADNSYSKFQFDLTVTANSIQAAKEAVNSSDWVNDTNATLVRALEGLF